MLLSFDWISDELSIDAYVRLALNRTMHHLARKKQSLDDFTYNDAVIAGEIYSAMNATQFLGVSVT